ncbi:MAG TPA: hypothetical protein VF018_04540 [Acidobacteriaceae bacterium]
MRRLCAFLVIVTWSTLACSQSVVGFPGALLQAETPTDVHRVITASSSGWTKICYVGSPQCSGGVGSHAPLGVPGMSFGLNAPNASTATPNAVAHFQMVDANQDVYTEVLYVNTVGKAKQALSFTRDFYEKFLPPAGITNLEWDIYQFDQAVGQDMMLGTQCNGQNHRIQYDNQGHGWVDTKVSCSTMMDGNWHHVHQTFHRDVASSTACSGMPCEHWDTLQIDDGTVDNLSAKLPVTRTTWSTFGAQWQIDARPSQASRSDPAVYDLYVDSDTVTASAADMRQ